jgi:hypothetical protein
MKKWGNFKWGDLGAFRRDPERLVTHGPTPAVWPKGRTLSSAGGPCLIPSKLRTGSPSWSAHRKMASLLSNEARRGVNGFGAFCRNKRSSPAGAKPATTENHVDTRVGDPAIKPFLPNSFNEGAIIFCMNPKKPYSIIPPRAKRGWFDAGSDGWLQMP